MDYNYARQCGCCCRTRISPQPIFLDEQESFREELRERREERRENRCCERQNNRNTVSERNYGRTNYENVFPSYSGRCHCGDRD